MAKELLLAGRFKDKCMSLIGFYVTCSVSFRSYNPDIRREVQIDATGVKCLVIEDRYDQVGSPGWFRTPYDVDCSKAIMWLKPTNTNGIFTFFKEDNTCNLEE